MVKASQQTFDKKFSTQISKCGALHISLIAFLAHRLLTCEVFA